MQGSPVWLASISRPSGLISNKRLATGLWSEPTREESYALLRRLLGPAGNPARERIFRMTVTVCIHRALTGEEVDRLPDYFFGDPPTDLAGGPVEILWENEAGLPSTKPCLNPTRHPIDPRDPLLWFPLDCGHCPPCKARAALYGDDVDAHRHGDLPPLVEALAPDALARTLRG
jgi:hypothetical protein